MAANINSKQLSAADREALTQALVYADAARLPLLLYRDRIHAAGLDDTDDLVGVVKERVRALNMILVGHVDITDLPRAGLPDWAVEATVRWRAERDRRGLGSAA